MSDVPFTSVAALNSFTGRGIIQRAPEGTEPYLRNINEEIVLAAWTNEDRVTFEPFIQGRTLGYRITDCETGRVEYILLAPTGQHDVNPDNGALADTFVYTLDADAAAEYDAEPTDSIIDSATPLTFVNHFETTTDSDV